MIILLLTYRKNYKMQKIAENNPKEIAIIIKAELMIAIDK
jgi:hypothetical protein